MLCDQSRPTIQKRGGRERRKELMWRSLKGVLMFGNLKERLKKGEEREENIKRNGSGIEDIPFNISSSDCEE